MKCHRCGKVMKYVKGLHFNQYTIDGWKCPCGETYYRPEQAQKVLLYHKLRKEVIRAKLGRIRSNLILRLPKDVEYAMGLENGKHVFIKVERGSFRIIPA